MKAVVAGHLLDLEGLGRQRFLLDRLELQLLRWDVLKREHFFQLIPVLGVPDFFVRVVWVRAVDRPRVGYFRRG